MDLKVIPCWLVEETKTRFLPRENLSTRLRRNLEREVFNTEKACYINVHCVKSKDQLMVGLT